MFYPVLCSSDEHCIDGTVQLSVWELGNRYDRQHVSRTPPVLLYTL